MIGKLTSTAQHYEIRLKGHMDARWGNHFEGLAITLEESGSTLLSGPVADQAALHGLLKKIRDLGLPLLSVQQVPSQEITSSGEKMRSTAPHTKKIDPKVLLSTLWIVIMFNMLKADILSLNIPGSAEELARTSVSSGASIPELMLAGGIMGELAMAMILLSRLLKHGINRWVNIVVGIVTLAYIWAGLAPYPHYIFIASVETICLVLIIWFAWMWRNVEA